MQTNNTRHIAANYFDADGLLLEPKFPTTGYLSECKVEGMRERMERHFERLKAYNSDSQKAKLIIITGRSVQQTEQIARDTGNQNWFICEHGTDFRKLPNYSTTIFDIVKEFGMYRTIIPKMAEIRKLIGDSHEYILKKLSEELGEVVVGNGLAPGKRFGASYDFPYLKRAGGERVNGRRVYEIIWGLLPKAYKELMYTEQENLVEIVGNTEKSLIRTYYDTSATNFTTPVKKPDAMSPEVLKFVLGREADQESVCFADDQDFGSIAEKKGLVCTVADGSNEIKAHIMQRIQNGGDGYISPYPNAEGSWDILQMIDKRNSSPRI